jgi:1-acyl-sn-glycerol-3-phosphate acyltransferase
MFRNIILSVGCIAIRRGRPDLTAIKCILARLSDGFGLCLFPEATRTSDGRIAPLKPGFSLIVRKSKAPIVPVVIDGAFECWPRHQKLFRPGQRISVNYGECIQPEKVEKMTDKELAQYMTDTMRDMLNKCRIKWGKKPYKY